MNRAVAVACLVIALAGFGWTYERVNRFSTLMETQARNSAALTTRLDALSAASAAILEQQRLLSPGDLGNGRLDVRLFMIRSQLAQTTNPIVFIGDSITEAARLPSELCGHPVVNAGIGGMTAASYADISEQILANIHAAGVVIALGTNDSSRLRPTLFEPRYLDLIGTARRHSKRILLVGIPQLGDGPLRTYFEPEAVSKNNATIRKIADENSLTFVDLSRLGKSSETVDGVHLSPKAYAAWISSISETACEPVEN